jgi:hypothetical protein
MTIPEQLRQKVRTLLDSRIQGVLATQYDRQPYTSLMAFAVTPDLHWIVFATYRATRKHANLLANDQSLAHKVISAALSFPWRQADYPRRSFAFSLQVQDASYDEEPEYQNAVRVGNEAQRKPRDACGEQNGQRDQERVCCLVHDAIVRDGLCREISRYP